MIDTVADLLEASIDETKTIILEKFRQRNFPVRAYHKTEAVPGSTRMYSNLTVGSDTPITRRIQNARFRRKMRIFTEEGYKVIFNHVREESKNFEKFLPKLYVENADARRKGK